MAVGMMGTAEARHARGPVRVRELDPPAVRAEWRTWGLEWPAAFTAPPWVSAWAETLGSDREVRWLVAEEAGAPIGAVPLVIAGDTAQVAGSPDVCDHLDLAARPGRQAEVCRALARFLARRGVRRLDAEAVRPDALLVRGWRAAGLPVDLPGVAVTVEMDLPGSWDGYLERLSKHDRHEVRRKLRRLEAAGPVVWRRSRDPAADLPVFLRLFRDSRPRKRAFLTPERLSFFHRLAAALAADGVLDLGILEVGDRPVAATFGFSWADTAHLYNNGFDPAWADRSVGLVAKVLSVRDAIERGMARYTFLRGDEPYKFRLGGRAVPLLGFRARLSPSGGGDR